MLKMGDNTLTAMKDVAAAILEKDGLILIAKKREGTHCAGKWEFPGGKVEANETPAACLQRELKEEFGIEAAIGEFITASEFDYGTIHIRLLAYRARHLSGEITLTDHSEVKWVTLPELQDYDFAGADIPIVKQLLPGLRMPGRTVRKEFLV